MTWNSKNTEPLVHAAKGEQEWNESYYFVFYDRKLDLRGMTRLGFNPNKNEGTAFFVLFLPDGSASLHVSSEKISDELRKTNLRVGTIAHQYFTNGSWRYRFDGNMVVAKNPEMLPQTRQHPELVDKIAKVKMDLSLMPINDPYEYSENMTPESRELGKKSGDAHWEQIGKIEGEIVVADDKFHVRNTIGQRDHTHGVRDWTGIGNWLYYVVWFSEELCVNPAAIVANNGRIFSGGFIFEKGKNIPIKAIKVLNQEFRNNVHPLSAKIKITDTLGRSHILEGKAGPTVPMSFVDSKGGLSILSQGFGDFVLDNRSGGYGSFETLRKMK